jgi:Co/Zn/Cd efflux system component
MSAGICVIIVFGAYNLVRESVDILLEAAPSHIGRVLGARQSHVDRPPFGYAAMALVTRPNVYRQGG